MDANLVTLVWVLGFVCGCLVIHVVAYCTPPRVVEQERPSSLPPSRRRPVADPSLHTWDGPLPTAVRDEDGTPAAFETMRRIG